MLHSAERAIRMSRRLRERLGLAPDEPLPAYAWPGGYPVYYLDREDSVLCAPCANRDAESLPTAVEYGINWEDPDLTCDDCSAAIECAYCPDDQERPVGEQRE